MSLLELHCNVSPNIAPLTFIFHPYSFKVQMSSHLKISLCSVNMRRITQYAQSELNDRKYKSLAGLFFSSLCSLLLILLHLVVHIGCLHFYYESYGKILIEIILFELVQLDLKWPYSDFPRGSSVSICFCSINIVRFQVNITIFSIILTDLYHLSSIQSLGFSYFQSNASHSTCLQHAFFFKSVPLEWVASVFKPPEGFEGDFGQDKN